MYTYVYIYICVCIYVLYIKHTIHKCHIYRHMDFGNKAHAATYYQLVYVYVPCLYMYIIVQLYIMRKQYHILLYCIVLCGIILYCSVSSYIDSIIVYTKLYYIVYDIYYISYIVYSILCIYIHQPLYIIYCTLYTQYVIYNI